MNKGKNKEMQRSHKLGPGTNAEKMAQAKQNATVNVGGESSSSK